MLNGINMYPARQIDVKNGVKQGAVLSPILFGVYMDVLVKRLKSSTVVCYIKHMF